MPLSEMSALGDHADLVDGRAGGEELDRELEDARRVEPHRERDLLGDGRGLEVRPADDSGRQDGPLVSGDDREPERGRL